MDFFRDRVLGKPGVAVVNFGDGGL
jgi:hypothetical protein